MTRALTLPIALCIALAGCGGGGDDGGGSATTVPAAQPVKVSAKEYSFGPKALVVTGGGPITLEVSNDGTQAHDLRVRRGGDTSFGGTPVFGPSQTQKAIVRLSPGEYEYFCSVGNHEQLGMKGKLTVK